MNAQTRVRLAGVMFLIIFVSGIIVFQFLQGPYLSSESLIENVSTHYQKLITSTLLQFGSGTLSIIISILLYPIFAKHSKTLATFYVAFCLVNMMALLIDNTSIFILVEFCKSSPLPGENQTAQTFLAFHWWTHYSFLLLSCLPVFILYFILFKYKLVPNIIGVVGLFAIIIMSIEMALSFYEKSLGVVAMIPLAIIQLVLPFWLLLKGIHIRVEG